MWRHRWRQSILYTVRTWRTRRRQKTAWVLRAGWWGVGRTEWLRRSMHDTVLSSRTALQQDSASPRRPPWRQTTNLYYCSVSENIVQHYVQHNFNKFARITIIFGKPYRECNGKVLAEPMSTSPNQWCHFTLQNEKVAILLHNNARTDTMQE